MSDFGFDHEWHLGELLDGAALARLGSALSELLAGDLAILDYDETLLWGVLAPAARRQPLVLELEPIGFIACAAASGVVSEGGLGRGRPVVHCLVARRIPLQDGFNAAS